jgi:hypothetical protein
MRARSSWETTLAKFGCDIEPVVGATSSSATAWRNLAGLEHTPHARLQILEGIDDIIFLGGLIESGPQESRIGQKAFSKHCFYR